MTSIRVAQPARERPEGRWPARPGSVGEQSSTASATVTVSTVTWERSTWGAGRSAAARR